MKEKIKFAKEFGGMFFGVMVMQSVLFGAIIICAINN